jgi:hypothetical protein
MAVPNTYAEVNEKSTSLLTFSFFDEIEAAVAPTTVQYRIDDLHSGTAILALTTLTGPFTATLDIVITSAQNALVLQTHTFEMRLVTVIFTYGGSKQGTGEYKYLVKNLSGVS